MALGNANAAQCAVALKDEILEMFRYYTQEGRVDDSVCFLVVQMRPGVLEVDESA